MLMIEERKLIVEYGKKLITSNLTKGTGGNISIYNRKEKLMAISPSGMDYFKTEIEDIVIMDLEGNIIEGENRPSSEYGMHRIFYKGRDDINALVHTHSTYAATLASLRWDLPAVHYLIALAGPNVRCAEYATYGTEELADNAFIAMNERKAVLLANHGLIAGDNSIQNAFNIAEEIEFCCELYYRSRSIGKPIILDDEEMNIVLEKFGTFKTYSQKEE